MPGPLHGIRILELSNVVLAPWACQSLADMGAEVIKVEPPSGDTNRALGPARNPGMASLFLACNRNKRSIVLDLKQPAAHSAVLKLAARADVLIHNNRPQVMDKLGLSYTDIRGINENIIYCGTYGYGRHGPYGSKGALDDSIQAISGITSLLENLAGEPRYVPTIVADKTTSMSVVSAVTAALFHRERTGEGQELEVPMFETMVHYVMTEHLWGQSFEPPIGTAGYTRLMTYHRKPFATRDGHISIMPYFDAHWSTFCALAGRPELDDDARFSTQELRFENVDDVFVEIERTMATRTNAEWMAALGQTSIPVMPISRLDDLIDDPHLKAVDFWRIVEHPTEGRLRMSRYPVSFSATPTDIRHLPPQLGEHSIEILQEIGLGQQAIREMLDAQATRTPAGPATDRETTGHERP